MPVAEGSKLNHRGRGAGVAGCSRRSGVSEERRNLRFDVGR